MTDDDLIAELRERGRTDLACSLAAERLRTIREEVGRLTREVERHRHGTTVDGDDVCPRELENKRLRTVLRVAVELVETVEKCVTEHAVCARITCGAEEVRYAYAMEKVDG